MEGSSARPPLALYIVVYSPSEDRANRTRSRPADDVCCIRAGGGKKPWLATVEGRKEAAFELPSPGRREEKPAVAGERLAGQ